MKKLYYKIMVSAIYTAKNSSVYYDIWKFTSSLCFAFATAIYSMFLYLLLNNYFFPNSLNFLKINIINGKYNFILNMLIYFIIPIIIINYILLFKDEKYKVLIKKYNKNYNKKLFVWYLMIAIIFMYITLFLKR